MVDGKVVQAETNTPSSSTCYMCGSKPSDINKIAEIKKNTIIKEYLECDLSPLHLIINCMEFILHIGYLMKIKTWRASGASNLGVGGIQVITQIFFGAPLFGRIIYQDK